MQGRNKEIRRNTTHKVMHKSEHDFVRILRKSLDLPQKHSERKIVASFLPTYDCLHRYIHYNTQKYNKRLNRDKITIVTLSIC